MDGSKYQETDNWGEVRDTALDSARSLMTYPAENPAPDRDRTTVPGSSRRGPQRLAQHAPEAP